MPTAPTYARAIANCAGLIAQVLYAVWFLGRRGRTIGMTAAGVRAVEHTTGLILTNRLAWRRALVAALLINFSTELGFFISLGQHRTTGHAALITGVADFLAVVLLLLTFLWPLGSSLNQTLQDKAAGSVVIRSELAETRVSGKWPS